MKFLKSLFLVVSLLSLSLFARADAQQIYGKWTLSMSFYQTTIQAILDIRETKTIVTTICTDGVNKVSVSVKGKSIVTDKVYTTISNTKKTKSKGDLDCVAAIKPETSYYEVNGNVLKLINPESGHALELERL